LREILKRFRSDFFGRNRRPALRQPTNGGAVAKDDDLPRVLGNLKTPAIYLAHKKVNANKPLYIARLASDHSTLLHGLRGEKVM